MLDFSKFCYSIGHWISLDITAGALVAEDIRIDVSGVTASEGHQGQVQLYRSPIESVSLPMLFKILFYFIFFFHCGFFFF